MITGGNGVGRCRDDDDNDDDFAAGWICTATTYPVLLLVLPPSSSARRPRASFPSPPVLFTWSPCFPHAFIPQSSFRSYSALHCQAESHSARGFATARWLLPGTVNGQQEIKLVKSLPMGEDGPPNLFFFFHLLK
jgi:hypothetical protein